ncbi:hypothetical protein GNP80_13675 [Aliivibrio fischeri]|uniref:hypothetical protein n=1 Tax=Aliivibrio fischeri TaxID=668 RepID=UPI0012DA784F|nr:hypothetical protein [Aliivibrio fischeri]MUK93481.1 hypothetical protein [Aliivibrio fischeri]
MKSKYIVFAIISMLAVFLSYIFHFYFSLGYKLSNDPSVWAQLGDYSGGLLNPILSFISLVLLIKSLNLQRETNIDLQDELKNNKKNEKLKSFETYFFNMINSQIVAFNSFKIVISIDGVTTIKTSTDAVIAIEDEVAKIRADFPNDNEKVLEFLNDLDYNDQLFSITRSFYIIVKMTEDKLSDENGFNSELRKQHILTLINFTEFALLRLIMLNMQFMTLPSVEYLKGSTDFKDVLKDTNLSFNLY